MTPRVRWEYGLLYVGLIAFLAYMTNEVDGQLSRSMPPRHFQQADDPDAGSV